MIVTHNAFDGVRPEEFGRLEWLWIVLHVPTEFVITERLRFLTSYPLIPWIGVIAVGYVFGRVQQMEALARRRWCLGLGAGLLVAFVVLRAMDVYGDERTWGGQRAGATSAMTSAEAGGARVRAPVNAGALRDVAAFLNCTKYPPSLLFLLMTLGPPLVVLPWLDRFRGRLADFLLIFGRVPLFYYLLHLPVIHATSLVYFRWASTNGGDPGESSRAGPEPNLVLVYAVWVAVVLGLYPVCR